MSFNNINWRKGLFRLWLVISILWIISFSPFTLERINKYYTQIQAEKEIKEAIERFDSSWPQKERAELKKQWAKKVGFILHDEKPQPSKETNPYLQAAKETNPFSQPIPDDEKVSISDLPTKTLVKSLPKEAKIKALSNLIVNFRSLSSVKQEELINALNYGSKAVKKEMAIYIFLTFAPPILTFLLCSALLWAFRGFLNTK